MLSLLEEGTWLIAVLKCEPIFGGMTFGGTPMNPELLTHFYILFASSRALRSKPAVMLLCPFESPDHGMVYVQTSLLHLLLTGLFHFPLSAVPENRNSLDSGQNFLVPVSWKLHSHKPASFVQGTLVVIFPVPFHTALTLSLLSQLRSENSTLKGLSPDPVPPQL